jgi:hypothetical protein
MVLVGLVLALVVWGWLDVRVRGTVDPNNLHIHMTDFTVYTEAGAAFFDGRDPYQVTNPRGWGYLYPPLFAILVAPLHYFNPQTQVMAWFALSLLLCWGCYRECVRIARRVLPDQPEHGLFGPIPTWVGCAAVAAALFPALNCLQRGQVGVAKLYLLLLGFRLLVESRSAARSFLAGTILALAIVLKITPLLPTLIVLFQELVAGYSQRAGRATLSRAGAGSMGTLCGLVLFFFLVPASLVGWSANLRHLNTWSSWATGPGQDLVKKGFAGDTTSPRNQSFTNAAHRFGNLIHYYLAANPREQGNDPSQTSGGARPMDAPSVNALLLVVRLLAGGLLLALAYRMGRASDLLGRAVVFSLACVATLIIAPIARGHYYVLFLPAVLFLTAWLVREQHARAAKCFAIVPAVLVIAHYALIDYVGRMGLLGLGTTLWYMSAVVFLLAHHCRGVTQRASQDDSPKEHSGGDWRLAA